MVRSAQISNLTAALRQFSSQFALTSGAAAIFAVLCATIFLFAYVRVFDWRLVWLVDYSDVLKVGIVAIAFFSGLAIYVWLVLSDAYEVAKPGSRGWMKYVVRTIWIGSMLYWLYREHETGEARYALVAFVFLSILMVFATAWWAVRTSARPEARGLMFLAFLCVLTVGILGTASATIPAMPGALSSMKHCWMEERVWLELGWSCSHLAMLSSTCQARRSRFLRQR